jgi:hypothetical protein
LFAGTPKLGVLFRSTTESLAITAVELAAVLDRDLAVDDDLSRHLTEGFGCWTTLRRFVR